VGLPVLTGRAKAAALRAYPVLARRLGVDRSRFRDQPVDLQVTSTFCGYHVGLQVLSITSFLTWVGVPASWTAVSDGTVTELDAELIRALHPCVEVVEMDDVLAGRDDVPPAIARWAATDFHGRKLALLTGLGRAAPPAELFLDSDVLFLPGAGAPDGFAAWLAEPGHMPAYLRDYRPAFNRRLLTDDDLARPPLNGGLLVVDRPLDFREADARLAAAGAPGRDGSGTEQTCTHLAAHAAGAVPLPPDRAVLTVDDARVLRDVALADDRTWLRHYTSGKRWKLWLAAARQRWWLRPPGR
jgi:hypothetical protein